MTITGFIWLDGVLEKLESRHNVSPQEVYQTFANQPRFRYVEKGHQSDENVYAAGGRTDAGRPLIVFFVYKKSGYALVLSARTMSRAERSRYGQR